MDAKYVIAKIGDEYSPALVSAVIELCRLVDEGVEFPDASWKVARKTGFMKHEVEQAYDRLHDA